MSREWKPGDVAIVNRHIALRLAYSVFTCPATHKFDGDHWHASNGHWACDDSTGHERARPLAVIDPEDREQVERLEALYLRDTHDTCENTADCMADALREFADPKPPTCRSSVEFRYGDGPFNTSACALDADHDGMHSAGPFMWGGAA